jgi:dolichyl-phosphate-mannose-protein mannosyltransferase
MRPSLLTGVARRPRVVAAVLVLAVAASLLAFQPLRSPWWSGYDFDSVYTGSALTLFRGERSRYYDHPGAPLQEALAATFTGAWAVSSPGESRATRADEWLENLDRARPYFRFWGSFTYLLSALIVFLAVAWVMRSAGWGLLAGLLFLGSPDVITWAAVVKPDSLLAALSVATVAVTVEGYRRRSPGLYLAAAALLGYALSVKVHAIGLVVPLAVAVLLRPPSSAWWRAFREDVREWLRIHRRLAIAVGAGWLALVIALNAGSAKPEARPLLQLLAGLLVLAVASTGLWLLVRRSRAAALAALTIGCGWVAIAGMILPNLFYASFPPVMAREAAITVTGGGPNVGARPAESPWEVLQPWQWLLVVAAIGLVKGLLDRDRTMLLWASGAVAMGLLAYLRYGHVHYYTAAIALTVPLVLTGVAALARRPGVLAALLVGGVLYFPYTTEIDKARGRSREAKRTEDVNQWVEPRLRPGEVALTQLESSHGRYFHLVRYYAPGAPELAYKFLPTDEQGASWVRERDIRVRFVITAAEADVSELLSSIGLSGQGRRVPEAPGFVYEVG